MTETNVNIGQAPALSFNLGEGSAFQSLRQRLGFSEPEEPAPAKVIDPSTLSVAERHAYDLQAQGFAAACLPVKEFGGQPVELELVVKADRPGTKRHWTGSEFFFAEAVRHAAKQTVMSYEYLDMTQAKNVTAPSDPDVEQKLRALEARYDERHPENTIVVFVKEGACQKVMSFTSFMATLERALAASTHEYAERQKKGTKVPALDVKHKRLVQFATWFYHAFERYAAKALVISGRPQDRVAANITKFTPTTVVVDDEVGF